MAIDTIDTARGFYDDDSSRDGQRLLTEIDAWLGAQSPGQGSAEVAEEEWYAYDIQRLDPDALGGLGRLAAETSWRMPKHMNTPRTLGWMSLEEMRRGQVNRGRFDTN